MADVFRQNRDQLHQLIDSMDCFTKWSLLARFRAGRAADDPFLVDPLMTIPEYLEVLREAHVLGYDGGVYFHLFPTRQVRCSPLPRQPKGSFEFAV